MMMSLEVERARMESTRESQAALQGQLVAKEAASEQTNSAIAKWEQAAKEASARWEQRQQELHQLASDLVRGGAGTPLATRH